MPRTINPKELKLLWGLSAGRCAICRKELSLDKSGGIVGQMAHIYAYNEDGPRGNADLPESERNLYPNLILLCPNDHAKIDKDESNWPSTQLIINKKRHEDWVRCSLVPPILKGNSEAPSKCLFVLSGPSAAGKDVIINRLIHKLESRARLATNLSRYTTRPRRLDDVSDIPFNYLSEADFHSKVEQKEIGCIHTSLGYWYGCDNNFSEVSPAGTALFYSMRVYSILPEIKKQAEQRGMNVRNILLKADEESIRSRILMRSSDMKDKLRRIKQSLEDISWLKSNPDFATGFFDITIDNSDMSRLSETVCRIDQYIENTFDEINELICWWRDDHNRI